MLKFKLLLSLCVLALSAYAQGNQITKIVPDSVLHVTKTDQKVIEFQVGASPVLAIGLADSGGTIRWDNYCQRPFELGKTGSVPNAGQVVTVITTNGVFGDKTAVDEMYRTYATDLAIWRKWQDLAKSYSTDSKTFVEQITSALADITLPDRTKSIEDFATFDTLKLLKGNLQFQSQTEDPRKTILFYLAHMVGVYEGCLTAARSGRAQ